MPPAAADGKDCLPPVEVAAHDLALDFEAGEKKKMTISPSLMNYSTVMPLGKAQLIPPPGECTSSEFGFEQMVVIKTS